MKQGLSIALVVGILLCQAMPARAQRGPADGMSEDKVASDVEKAISDLNGAFVQLAQWCEASLMWKHAEATYSAALSCEPPSTSDLERARDRATQNHNKVDSNPAVAQYAICAKKAETLRTTYSKRLLVLAEQATALGLSGIADRASAVARRLDPPVGKGDPEFCEKYKALIAQRAGAYYDIASSCEAKKMWGEAESVLGFVEGECPQRWEVEAEIEVAAKRKALVNSRPSKEQTTAFTRQLQTVRATFQKKFDELARWAESKSLTQEAELARSARDEGP